MPEGDSGGIHVDTVEMANLLRALESMLRLLSSSAWQVAQAMKWIKERISLVALYGAFGGDIWSLLSDLVDEWFYNVVPDTEAMMQEG